MDDRLALRIMSVLSVVFGVTVAILASNSSPAMLPFAMTGGIVLIVLWIAFGLLRGKLAARRGANR